MDNLIEHNKRGKVKDFRNSGKSFYKAKCTICGRIFYPSRPAKYCSQGCANKKYHDNRVKNKKTMTDKKEKVKKANELILKAIDKYKKGGKVKESEFVTVYDGNINNNWIYFLKDKGVDIDVISAIGTDAGNMILESEKHKRTEDYVISIVDKERLIIKVKKG